MNNQSDNGNTDFLRDFGETIEIAAGRLLQIPDNKSAVPRVEGKWSRKEIMGHLIDSAANNHSRFVRAQFTDELVFPGYEQNAWVESQRYQEKPWQELVELWKLYNRHILHIMKVTPVETRMKLRHKHNLHVIASDQIKPEDPVTLDFFMRDYVEHMKKHLGQILD
jgi:hypothetical protein